MFIARPTLAAALLAALLSTSPAPAAAQAPTMAVMASSGADVVILQAREALRRRDRNALALARQQASLARHPLAMWVEYWELGNRLSEARQPELDAFYQRWPGSYVEDRLRNDWLLELGRRRDWSNFRADHPRFRMNDDREVACYALLLQHLDGRDVRGAARSAWAGQRDVDDGCTLLARTLLEAGVFKPDDVWQVARTAIEFGRPRVARAAAALLNPAAAKAVDELLDNPQRFLAKRPAANAPTGVGGNELALLALMKLAANDPDYTAAQLDGPWAQRLPLAMTATAWAHTAKQAALKQLPQAAAYSRRAWRLWDAASKPGTQPSAWGDDLLGWQVRAALRAPATDKDRWQLVQRGIQAMSDGEQRDGTWVYWQARATMALAAAGADGDAARIAARTALEGLAQQLGFYGRLAAEDLGLPVPLPSPPLAISAAERDAARGNPGLTRALQLINLGLRGEGVREWNFSLRGLQDRELLAAAQWACDSEVWDRCISTSERTRADIDMTQRFPTPHRAQVAAAARQAGLDPAVLYGLIRQESRFVVEARSGVGASGLMQVMPATAQWTARKIGFDYRPEMLVDRDVNLLLGAAYLKRMVDDFGGSLAMAAAAYNAGPGRPRRWREGGSVMEPAAWAESIPFNETRDYVKKVLSNSVYYAALLAQPAPPLPPATGIGAAQRALPPAADAAALPVSLRLRLGPPIGPADGGARLPDRGDRDLP